MLWDGTAGWARNSLKLFTDHVKHQGLNTSHPSRHSTGKVSEGNTATYLPTEGRLTGTIIIDAAIYKWVNENSVTVP
jgi:hypothetical protein